MKKISSRRTIADGVAFLVPFILLGGLALAGGGFDLFGRHVAGVAAWIAVVALVLSNTEHDLRLGAGFWILTALLLALATLSAVSSFWSSSIHNSLVEADRLIAYLGFFFLGFFACRNERMRRHFVWGLVAALGFTLLLALGSRLLPGPGIPSDFNSARLSFPLGYWNANGLLFGMAAVGFAWAAGQARAVPLKLLAAAGVPAAVIGLYLTYSRGGAIAGLITLVSIFFLSRDRLRIAATAVIGVVCSIPAIKVIQSNPTIADNLGGADAPAQGREVLAALVVVMLVSALIFQGMRLVASRFRGLSGRLLSISRDRRFLGVIATAAFALLAGITVTTGGHVWKEFSGANVYFPSDPQAHFTQLSGAGRYQFNQVAIETFAENPLTGTGAGTYKFEWAAHRPIDLVAQDAHSLYLEALSDLGILGGLLALALAATAIWMAISAWHRLDLRDRSFASLMIAFLLAILVAFGIDWFWELGATAAFLMLVCGWLAASSDRGRNRWAGTPPAKWLVLAVAWGAIVMLTVPATADRYMAASVKATDSGQLGDAVSRAQTASQLAPFWARPRMQLGVLAQSAGLDGKAIAEFDEAIDLEPDNWQTWYLRSKAEKQFGRDSAAARDLEEAKRRNPRAPELSRG